MQGSEASSVEWRKRAEERALFGAAIGVGRKKKCKRMRNASISMRNEESVVKEKSGEVRESEYVCLVLPRSLLAILSSLGCWRRDQLVAYCVAVLVSQLHWPGAQPHAEPLLQH